MWRKGISIQVRHLGIESAHGPLTRNVKLGVAHAPGMPGTFSPPPRVSDPDMHHGTCVTHVLWCMPGSLTRGFLWSRWRGKRSRHSRCMRNPQFHVPGKKPIVRNVRPLCINRSIHVISKAYLCVRGYKLKWKRHVMTPFAGISDRFSVFV